MCVTFVTCEVRVCGLRCRSGSSLYIYRVYYLSHCWRFRPAIPPAPLAAGPPRTARERVPEAAAAAKRRTRRPRLSGWMLPISLKWTQS